MFSYIFFEVYSSGKIEVPVKGVGYFIDAGVGKFVYGGLVTVLYRGSYVVILGIDNILGL